MNTTAISEVKVKAFNFNPIQENTYVLYDETKECVIIDAGCYDDAERKTLTDFIKKENLKPIKLLNTHCHFDHVLGNKFIAHEYNIPLEIHQKELPVLASLLQVAGMYGFTNVDASPQPANYLQDGDTVKFGNSQLHVLFTPGHSPGSICFYNKEKNFAVVGDVLFYGSIGRTDLPGGDSDTLLNSIKQKLLVLPSATKIYSGHGPSTSIGFEKEHNPFL